ncbi:hemerythrin domain-containing protein [Streptacidiphilus sp. PB12-B1b]|uniref:hemerythrin domain-containing protein n=1 Tax=Streptacidiphilus sp. PB12-B1b TaxID=2705012 RepID=UPI0015FA9322|nr:hemerythrin domain-containing protein [Streptacidiphilus sp. PB12-B1b]QMU77992.1 hemerythrin domain-containing protein [Streptacidiphilus sp. PB12-B1b]
MAIDTSRSTPLAPHPYTQEMEMIHRIFRRESLLLAKLIGAVDEGDVRRAGLLAEAWRTYALGLHLHHAGEDDLVWPKLLERAELDAARVQRMEAQHHELSAGLERVEKLLEPWASTASVPARDDLVQALVEHNRTLCSHLDEEEREVMPLVAQHISAAEWREVGERGLAETPRNKRLIALGAILEDASDEERAEFLGRLPGPARLVWRLVGQRQYRSHVRRIRGEDSRGLRQPGW